MNDFDFISFYNFVNQPEGNYTKIYDTELKLIILYNVPKTKYYYAVIEIIKYDVCISYVIKFCKEKIEEYNHSKYNLFTRRKEKLTYKDLLSEFLCIYFPLDIEIKEPEVE